MKLENEFTVPAHIDDAWAILIDVERVAPCLPGAAIHGTGDDGEFDGTMTVKIGPITARYKGSVKVQEADEAAHRCVMRAQAKDARGQGSAAATITSTMQERPDGTHVHVLTDMRVTGPAAQFGRGVMQDVSAKMMRQFAECLAQEMHGPGAEPTGGEAVAGGPVPGDETAAPVATEPSAGGEVLSGGHGGPAEATAPSAGGDVLAGGGPEAVAAEPPKPRPTPEVLDLGEVSREAVLKRAVPVVGAALVLLILLRLIRR